MSDIFASRPANSRMNDLNLGAGSLRYEEVRSKSGTPAHFGPSTSLQFEFSSAGRYVMLSESYFEVHYTAFLKTAGGAIDAAASYVAYTSTNTSSKGLGGADTTCTMGLQEDWPDLAINSIRHSISGTQISSSNDVALQRTVMKSAQSAGYNAAAASAFAAGTIKQRQDMLQHGTKGAVGWCPPLGVWKSNTLIPGSAVQRIDIDVKDVSQYLMQVHQPSSVHATGGLTSVNFKHASAGYSASGYTTAVQANQESYFSIDNIVLRVATVTAQDGRLPPASMLVETRDVEIQRIPVGTQQTCDRQLLIPGSTFKLAVFSQQDADSDKASGRAAKPSLRSDTLITSLSLHVDGMQLPAPEYTIDNDSARDIQRMYLDFLAANGSLYEEGVESGCSITFNDYQSRPMVMSRLVSQSGLAKDLLVRVRYAATNITNKTIIVGAIHQRAMALTFDGSGNCTSVQVTGL